MVVLRLEVQDETCKILGQRLHPKCVFLAAKYLMVGVVGLRMPFQMRKKCFDILVYIVLIFQC